MLGLNIRLITLPPRYLAILSAFAAPFQGIIRMQEIIPAIYFDSHVGPFRQYPAAAYAITVATHRDKRAMPKWRNNILVQLPDVADDNAVCRLLTTVAKHGRVILLFLDFATFKGWQLLLAQVLA
jgi:hypothetical protein